MVPLLYLLYSHSSASLTGQTAVAHATSLSVALASSLRGTWRYGRAGAVAWRSSLGYGIPAVVSAFLTARLVTTLHNLTWLRGVFGAFLLFSAADMIRRAYYHGDREHAGGNHPHGHPLLLGTIGACGGVVSGLLGIGGGLIAVPTFLYASRLPVRNIAPSSLAAVALATAAGCIGYATASGAPAVSHMMVGFVDLRLALPLMLGALATVPLGVRLNRASRPVTLYWVFALVLAAVGSRLLWRAFGP